MSCHTGNWRALSGQVRVSHDKANLQEGNMASRVWISLAFAATLAVPAVAQNAAPDAKAALAAADAAMGVSKANSLQYSATGYITALGQNYSSSLDETWPRFELKSFTRTIDFPSNSMREDQTR